MEHLLRQASAKTDIGLALARYIPRRRGVLTSSRTFWDVLSLEMQPERLFSARRSARSSRCATRSPVTEQLLSKTHNPRTACATISCTPLRKCECCCWVSRECGGSVNADAAMESTPRITDGISIASVARKSKLVWRRALIRLYSCT